jgi:imidazole glycerol phosphate synthase subunit HisF
MEALGAGEILLNCIDEDGQGNGQGLTLVHFSAQLEPFLTQNTP